jgi:hypothetical protein
MLREEELMKSIFTRYSKFVLVMAFGLMLPQAFAQPQSNKDGATQKTMAAASFAAKVRGHGTPLILIPGLSSSGDTWTTRKQPNSRLEIRHDEEESSAARNTTLQVSITQIFPTPN